MSAFDLIDSAALEDAPGGLNLALIEDGDEFYWWIPRERLYSQGFRTERLALKALRSGQLWFLPARTH